MEEVKDKGKVHIITFDGYKIACFIDTKDEKGALNIIEKEKLDAAILSSENNKASFKYTFHIITYKSNISVSHLANVLIAKGKDTGLYAKHTFSNTEKSAKVYAANIKLLK
jgi:hypothetical protein